MSIVMLLVGGFVMCQLFGVVLVYYLFFSLNDWAHQL